MPTRAVVLTISDRCAAGAAEDRSGPALIEHLDDLHASLIHREIIPDDADRIAAAVAAWIGRCDVILATGGTGVAKRDVTPDAIQPLIERPLPGFGEAMRMSVFPRNPLSVLSRAGAGIASATLIVWLPGSPRACQECIQSLAPAIQHVVAFLGGTTPH